jgi:hypothetical protein
MRIDSVVLNERKTLQQLINALTNRLTFEDNFQCTIVSIADTGAADTEFVVTHKLGKIPTAYIANLESAGEVYSTGKDTWTTTQMTLKCSAANAKLTLVVF